MTECWCQIYFDESLHHIREDKAFKDVTRQHVTRTEAAATTKRQKWGCRTNRSAECPSRTTPEFFSCDCLDLGRENMDSGQCKWSRLITSQKKWWWENLSENFSDICIVFTINQCPHDAIITLILWMAAVGALIGHKAGLSELCGHYTVNTYLMSTHPI